MTYDGASKTSQCHWEGAVRYLEIPEEYLETYEPNQEDLDKEDQNAVEKVVTGISKLKSLH